ncbi:MAG: DUF1295 domain-containing protein [Spirochaetota bacterium]
MKYFSPLFLFLPILITLALSETFVSFFSINAIVQIFLFLFVVHIPAYKTGRMSYVDIAWPLGVLAIGVLAIVVGEGAPIKKYSIGVVYICIGGRMGIASLVWLYRGAFTKELPRYKFQRIRWGKEKKTNVQLAMQIDIFIQSLANTTYLSLPALFLAFDPKESVHPLEIFGLVVWFLAISLEYIADAQKSNFAKQAIADGRRKDVCTVGLWRYTRHPNYFFEWMVWNALICMALPACTAWFFKADLLLGIFLSIGLLYISRLMYNTLVLFTGALPSEYYSVKKRPGYKKYRQSTNMFFPGKPRFK